MDRGQIRPEAKTEIAFDSGAVVVLDGGFGFGPVVGHEAVDLVVERGRRSGVACVVVRNANHLGRLGEFTSAVASAGLAAVLFANCQGSGQLLAPFGGADRRLTNNPISIAVPGPEHVVLLDMALSVVAEAKVWLAKARGASLPDGWILDAEGQPSRDPDALFEGGTLLPLGSPSAGHKGYALIVLVDILAGLLSGGGVCGPDLPEDFSNSFLLLAVDVEPLVPARQYEGAVGRLADYVKAARRLPGVEAILFPGEFEAVSERRRAAEGIWVEDETWKAIGTLAREADVPLPA
jgi:LDH2 family malate/lactate/ureidoglycolate dehydrogenase